MILGCQSQMVWTEQLNSGTHHRKPRLSKVWWVSIKKLRFSINTYWLDEKRLKSANINNLLIRDKNKEVIKTCKSESLKKFQEKRVQFRSLSKKKEEDSDCSIELPDYKAGEKSLEKLNDEVMAAEYLKKFKKVISFYWFRLWLSFFFIQGKRAPTFDPDFPKAAKKFAWEFLLHVKYEDLVARMEFFREHPRVNEEILDYAFVEAQMRRKDLALEPPNPIEVCCDIQMTTHSFISL